ncbi:MAG: hypothetical protein KDD62_14575, partial [Bdellovibrionales bacterium]|nr:hypothetical protein [Bdellovibrionales bacterium]
MDYIKLANKLILVLFSFLAFTPTLWAAEDCASSAEGIPDNSAVGLTKTLNVSAHVDKVIKDLNVRLNINHTKRGD